MVWCSGEGKGYGLKEINYLETMKKKERRRFRKMKNDDEI